MTLVTGAPPEVGAIVPRRGALHRFVRNPLGLASAVFMLLLVVVAALAPVLGLPDPNAVDLNQAMQPPGPGHVLGTDTSGRDVLSRLVWGSRTNLLGATLALAVAFALGVASGLIAGYYGGWFDSVASWITNLNMALPGIVVLLAARAVVGPSVFIAMAIFGVLLAPAFFRVVRGAVQSVRNDLYVDAARVSGLSDARIIGRHILTVVRAPVIIQAARVGSIAISIQAGLEFLGVSDPTVPSWGNMLNEGFRRISVAPQLILWPSLLIGLVCMALVLIGNAARDALEDRGSAARGRRRNRRPAAAAEPLPPDAVAPVPAHAPTSSLLSVSDLRVAYRTGDGEREVVHGVDLHVDSGEVLGLVGESGSGKTQTAFAVLGLLPDGGRVSGGTIRFDGRDLAHLSEDELARLRGTDIAYIPQEPMSNLDPTARIGHQLTLPLRTRLGLSRAEAKSRALQLLARVGIPDPEKTFNSYPHQISGGMAQRVLIAGAVSCEPRLLIADEPTTALDVTVQAEVLDLLRDLQRERGMAVILVTHNFGVVSDICDRVAVMQAGRIAETADVETIFARPEHPYTRKLLGSMIRDDAPARPYPFDDGPVVTAAAGRE